MNAILPVGQPSGSDVMIPRLREAGDVTLDLFHRDGRIADRWLAFYPREFALHWRLSEHPGGRMTRQQLLAKVWRLDFDRETNGVAVHVARVRAKLNPFGYARLIAAHAQGGSYLDPGLGRHSEGAGKRPRVNSAGC